MRGMPPPAVDQHRANKAPLSNSPPTSSHRSSHSSTPTQGPQGDTGTSAKITWENKQAGIHFELTESGHEFWQKFQKALGRIKFTLPFDECSAEFHADGNSYAMNLGEPLENEWPLVLDFIQEHRVPEKRPQFVIKIESG
jgi:hypothetical protein